MNSDSWAWVELNYRPHAYQAANISAPSPARWRISLTIRAICPGGLGAENGRKLAESTPQATPRGLSGRRVVSAHDSHIARQRRQRLRPLSLAACLSCAEVDSNGAELRGARRLWRAGEDLGATFSRCSPREFYPSLAYVRSPHRPLKYAGGCNADWSRACISSCLTSFSLPARAPARTILFPSLIQYPQ